MTRSGPIYENQDFVDPDTLAEYEAWRERSLQEDRSRERPAGEMPNCLNCGTPLRGQYCGQCGQRARSRLISLWELISDAFGDLLEIDSRLWRTLTPLMFRPGLLTHDYLQGRRARFMPPFRMYLVLSLAFFVIAFFDPREELGILFEPESGTDTAAQVEAESDAPRIVIDSDDDDGVDCESEDFVAEGMPDWMARRFTPERLQQVCTQIVQDDGRQFAEKLLDNLPAALIVLLPVMAFVLKLLYPLSRRYYVEHLLFFVHFHAFFFLILTLEILLTRLMDWLPVPDLIGILTFAAVLLYVPAYLFIAMRRVYGQGRFITFLKYIVLTISYLAGITVTMLAAFAIAAFSM